VVSEEDDREVVEVDEGSDLLRRVIQLANGPSNRTLGLLPDQAFAERARKGTLLALVDNGRVVAYLLYDLPRYEVKIVHLGVDPEARRSGAARRLVTQLPERHSDRRRIILACRRDYDADELWRALEFRPVATRPGRSKDGHMLTIWVFDFEEQTLFDEYQDDRDAVALDHNVFLDLLMGPDKRPEGAESSYLLDDWIGEYVELCVTDEIFSEINRHDDATERSAEQRAALSYRNLSKPHDEWAELVEEVAELAPRAGKSDHRHVSRAVAGGAKYLVSRDGDLVDGADRIERTLGIRVLRPEELIVRLDQLRSEGPYRPVALEGTALSQFAPTHDLHAALESDLLNHGGGERKSELGRRLRPMLADRDHDVRVVQTLDGKTVAGFSRRTDGGELEVPFLRVVPGSVGANVIARQLLFAQRKFAADNDLESVRITDPHLSRDVREGLTLEHFSQEGEVWTCHVKTGLLPLPEVSADGRLPRDEAIAYEESFWPAKVVGAGIETFLVPIKVAFAEALLDPGLAEQSLIRRQLGLGLNREHVYYRSTRNARGIRKGSRILWYVTGDSPVHSSGSVRAVSHVADVVVGRPRSLHARFQRFGVYSLKQVSAAQDRNGEVMALRFVDTEVLEAPLDLGSLKELRSENGERFVAPQSPTAISEHMFCLVYERSSRYGR
jgi:ribosomal protein S18 acetylase RimI-like enzyme